VIDDTAPMIENCLKRLTAVERLGEGDGNGISCQACGEKHPHEKREALAALPPALCLHVKRFRQRYRQVQRDIAHEKSNGHVSFPLRDLDLTPFTEACVMFGVPAAAASHGDAVADADSVSEADQTAEAAAPAMAAASVSSAASVSPVSASASGHLYDLFAVSSIPIRLPFLCFGVLAVVSCACCS
jgi:hypothetical protein